MKEMARALIQQLLAVLFIRYCYMVTVPNPHVPSVVLLLL